MKCMELGVLSGRLTCLQTLLVITSLRTISPTQHKNSQLKMYSLQFFIFTEVEVHNSLVQICNTFFLTYLCTQSHWLNGRASVDFEVNFGTSVAETVSSSH